MSSLGFNPIAPSLTFVQTLQRSHSFEFTPSLDDGTPEGGAKAVSYSVSIGQGRGSAKVELTGDQFSDVAQTLRDWDPETTNGNVGSLSPADAVRHSISRDEDGTTSFKLSLEKNSRSVRVPADGWAAYLDLLDALADCAHRVPEGYLLSVDTGERGSTRMELTGPQLIEVSELLGGWGPVQVSADLSSFSPAEAIRSTISRETDGVTTFKVSLEKNSRTVKIPAGQWESFVGYMEACAQSIPDAVEFYRSEVLAMEAEANSEE